MNNLDRGIIKWQPFNSLLNGKYLINSLLIEKSKITKPLLSEEEQSELEKKIIESYYYQNVVFISYYKEGYIFKTKSKIKKIDLVYKTIYLENKTKLLFNQILKIKFE